MKKKRTNQELVEEIQRLIRIRAPFNDTIPGEVYERAISDGLRDGLSETLTDGQHRNKAPND